MGLNRIVWDNCGQIWTIGDTLDRLRRCDSMPQKASKGHKRPQEATQGHKKPQQQERQPETVDDKKLQLATVGNQRAIKGDNWRQLETTGNKKSSARWVGSAGIGT